MIPRRHIVHMYYSIVSTVWGVSEIHLYHVGAQRARERDMGRPTVHQFALPHCSRFKSDFVSGDGHISVHLYLRTALGVPLATSQLDGGLVVHVLSAPNCTGQGTLCPRGLLIAYRKDFQGENLRLPPYRLSHGLQLHSSALQDLAPCAAAIVA